MGMSTGSTVSRRFVSVVFGFERSSTNPANEQGTLCIPSRLTQPAKTWLLPIQHDPHFVPAFSRMGCAPLCLMLLFAIFTVTGFIPIHHNPHFVPTFCCVSRAPLRIACHLTLFAVMGFIPIQHNSHFVPAFACMGRAPLCVMLLFATLAITGFVPIQHDPHLVPAFACVRRVPLRVAFLLAVPAVSRSIPVVEEVHLVPAFSGVLGSPSTHIDNPGGTTLATSQVRNERLCWPITHSMTRVTLSPLGSKSERFQ
jgi:hypothetical protein